MCRFEGNTDDARQNRINERKKSDREPSASLLPRWHVGKTANGPKQANHNGARTRHRRFSPLRTSTMRQRSKQQRRQNGSMHAPDVGPAGVEDVHAADVKKTPV